MIGVTKLAIRRCPVGGGVDIPKVVAFGIVPRDGLIGELKRNARGVRHECGIAIGLGIVEHEIVGVTDQADDTVADDREATGLRNGLQHDGDDTVTDIEPAGGECRARDAVYAERDPVLQGHEASRAALARQRGTTVDRECATQRPGDVHPAGVYCHEAGQRIRAAERQRTDAILRQVSGAGNDAGIGDRGIVGDGQRATLDVGVAARRAAAGKLAKGLVGIEAHRRTGHVCHDQLAVVYDG